MTIILGMMHLEYESKTILQNVAGKNGIACQNTQIFMTDAFRISNLK